MFDIAIVGGGPAGLSAAVNARRRNKSAIIVSKENDSFKLVQSHRIENYLGLSDTGQELAAKFRAHAESLGVDFIKDEVQSIYQDGALFNLMGRNQMIESKVVILASGISMGTEITGEAEWIGRGVSYCVTCDGMFFKNKTVAVIGYIPEAEAELLFLVDICAQVYYLPQYKIVGALDPRITLLREKPLAISGTDKIESLMTSTSELKVDGIFIERSARPVEQLLIDLKTDGGFIVCDFNQATNLPGVFAAGDCTGKPWQIARAVGQGQVAALNAVSYLDDIE